MSDSTIQEMLNDKKLGDANRELLAEYEKQYESLIADSGAVGLASVQEAISILRDLAVQTSKSYENITKSDMEAYLSKVPREKLSQQKIVIWNFYRRLYHSYIEILPPVTVEDTYAWLAEASREEIRSHHL